MSETLWGNKTCNMMVKISSEINLEVLKFRTTHADYKL